MNAALAQYTEKSREQRAGPPSAITPDQLRMLSHSDAKAADAEKQLVRIIQQIDDGTYVDTEIAPPIAAFDAIKHFQEALNKRLAVAQWTPLLGGQNAVGEIRTGLEAALEKARNQQRVKTLILEYEQAYLKWLTRKRARPWW